MRRAQIDYRQVTKEALVRPGTWVRMVHRLLVDNGYDGPPPDFAGRWEQLFTRLRDLEACRRHAGPTTAVSWDWNGSAESVLRHRCMGLAGCGGG
jgi:hypothetical protein